ncbi:glucan biosynthesis protein G [Thioalkalicoccus limnaeus]|uniref:Glucans biosynthesis protein G n=1 Tax=Thioalkalicoccus limnaeus TaxID=120681 RepID=A0ABV4B9B7_9GAMM
MDKRVVRFPGALLALAIALASSGFASGEATIDPVGIDEGVPGGFTFASVARRASDLVANPYAPDRPELPHYFADLDYDKYRDIRFQRDQSLWAAEGLPFRVQFFPRGFMFEDRVVINVVDQGHAVPVDFVGSLFDYGKNPVPTDIPADIGFAGLRLLYPLNRDDVFDEVAVFLGASYFRAVAQGLHYGISARGLAIDTGLASNEEFPVFREFWIEKPDRDATEITVYALMDSESLTGAYRFRIQPGLQTLIDVKAQLFFRDSVQKLGIAPLTSMFFHGENTERFIDDFRPEVHDSDGLVIETGHGERIWRPLTNPHGLRITDLQVTSPKAFGLLQRDRDFTHYQDLEAHYQDRPSVLVEPLADWGKGVVQLVEIPSDSERYDNIVAFWVPETPVQAGQQMALEYRLRFSRDPEAELLGGRTWATRIGAGGTDILDRTRRKFVMDFVGDSLANQPPEAPVEAVVSASSGALSDAVAQPNPEINGWRLFFELTPDGDTPVDLRAFLRKGPDVLTETWTYHWVRE